ncbi:MAG: phosphate signaling complex protein PhoU [Spirochaetales bacterium]
METRLQLDQQLKELYQQILKMGALVEEGLRKSVEALRSNDEALAKAVIDEDQKIDALHVSIEDMSTQIIAMEQPVATDLRELITANKIVGDLERIGDHARHIARRVGKLPDDLLARALPSIESMAGVGIGMVHDSITAYVEQDESKAREVAELDDQIDAAHKALYKTLVTSMQERSDWIEYGVELMFLNRYMERLGDHVTNICEWVIFAKSGQHVELNK